MQQTDIQKQVRLPYALEEDYYRLLNEYKAKKHEIYKIRKRKHPRFDPEKHLEGELKKLYYKMYRLQPPTTTENNSN